MDFQRKNNLADWRTRGGFVFLILLACAVNLTAKNTSPVKIFSPASGKTFRALSVQDKVLTPETAAALLEELTESLKGAVEDEEKVDAITEKWSGRNLVGKTRRQAVEQLLTDVQSVITDNALIKKLSDEWNSKEEEEELEEAEQKTDEKKPDEDEKPDADEKPEA